MQKIKLFLMIWILSLLGTIGTAFAQTDRQESSDFTTVASSGQVIVSTSSWTGVPSTSTIDRSRWSVMLDNPASNTSNMLWRITNDDLEPAATDYGFTTTPSDPPMILSISGFMRLWLISLNATAEPVYFEELK